MCNRSEIYIYILWYRGRRAWVIYWASVITIKKNNECQQERERGRGRTRERGERENKRVSERLSDRVRRHTRDTEWHILYVYVFACIYKNTHTHTHSHTHIPATINIHKLYKLKNMSHLKYERSSQCTYVRHTLVCFYM